MKELDLQEIHVKIQNYRIHQLSEREIDFLIDQHWYEWTGKFELSPCGDLTLSGKREYLNDNHENILELITEFPGGLS